MKAEDQRIAELEAEVNRLRALLAGAELRIKHKVRRPGHRPASVAEAVQRARREHLRELLGGLGLLGRVVLVAALLLAGLYLVDHLRQQPIPPAPPDTPFASPRD
jgi:hypothetical protein